MKTKIAKTGVNIVIFVLCFLAVFIPLALMLRMIP